jgi:16S rRNA (guanine527-N7)-methyltransferase
VFHVEQMTPSDLDAHLESLRRGALALGLCLLPQQQARFRRYFEVLSRWGRALRLTGLRDPGAWVEAHFLDSLTALPFVEKAHSLLDVGSGAGFPGVPLSICRDALAVSLMEPHGKKASFLRMLADELALPQVQVLQARVEDCPKPCFDVVISRATWSVEEWVPRGAAWLARRDPSRGTLVAMLGKRVPGQGILLRIGEAAGLSLCSISHLRLPLSGAQRTLVAWRTTGAEGRQNSS